MGRGVFVCVVQVGPGIVKSVTDYGAFVEMGGRDGLLHVSDMNGLSLTHTSH
jgi:small subunit ribosomal protein S1